MHTGRYDLMTEDGRIFAALGASNFATPGGRYTVILRGPRPPIQFGGGMPPPPPPMRPRYAASIQSVSSSSSLGGVPTWEMERQLGLVASEPVETAADEEEEAKLADLVKRWTNAPDADFDGDVSEGVLGAAYDAFDDDSDGTRSTLSTVG